MDWLTRHRKPVLAVLAAALLPVPAADAEEGKHPAVSEVVASRPYLRYERPAYRNFVYDPFQQYPDHTWSVRTVGSQQGGGVALGLDRQQDIYDPMGNYLSTAYDLFYWIERRQPEQRWGSELFKDWSAWHLVFSNVAVARDGYGGWGYSVLAGDGLLARFSPLTLSKTDLNGLRLDLSTPYVKFTGVGSRIARPNRETYQPAENVGQIEVDHSTMLVGARAQVDLGRLSLGVNGANLHSYNSTQPGNRARGMLRLDQPLFEWLIVRVSDDAPEDGRGGASVQEVGLVVNGHPRPDLQPRVIRHRAGAPSQVGRTLSGSGDFLPVYYTSLSGPPGYYRGREIPLFADYLYRLAHEGGADVSGDTHLEGLVANFALETSEGILRADGPDQLIFLFDLQQEPLVESVEVEALVGDDYRLEWASVYVYPGNAGAAKFEQRFRSTFFRQALRSRGRVEDGSNLRRVRFEVGENTAIFTYSADMHLRLPWLEVSGEYARSTVYGRYPARAGEQPLLDRSPRIDQGGSAYFVNALHRFGRGRVGAEFFSMNPGFTTEMETYLARDYGYRSDRAYGVMTNLANESVIWRLVQDNEDGDRWPDVLLGNVLGSPQVRAREGDGVFPGQDEDRDGQVDTDQNFNGIPDYEETFLMYAVEPNDYAYGLDRNNNDEPDHREDDWAADYPYDADQRGFHLFGQLNLGRHGSLALGRYAVEALSGGGRNRSTYALVNYRREGVMRVRRIFFENQFRRVEDDIPDEFNEYVLGGFEGIDAYTQQFEGAVRRLGGILRVHPDLLYYQDSYVNETNLEGRFRPFAGLHLVQKLRLRLNWQQGGRLANGLFQRQRRLDFWTWVSQVEYGLHWGKFSLKPQFKFLVLRLADQGAGSVLRSESRVIPILKLRYRLMTRSALQVGVQGWGPLPYRLADRTEKRNSLELRTAVITLTNSSRYFGYDMQTIVGLQREELDWDDRYQSFRNFDGWSFFVRNLIGFTEFGRVL